MDQGRAYLVGKLRERGLSKRQTVRILNMIFREMGQALKLGVRQPEESQAAE
jgi:hypothetical protein